MGYWATKYKDGIPMVSHESIDFQLRKKLEGLAKVVGEFRSVGDLTRTAYDKSPIVTYIFNTFGITILLRRGAEIGVSDKQLFAAVQPPQLDKNHPLVPNFQRAFVTADDLLSYTKIAKNNNLMGVVDRVNARITGAFSDILCPMYLSTGLLLDRDFTDIEIASIIAHEVGHVFTYFELFRNTTITNLIVAGATKRMLRTESKVERLKIVHEVEKHAGVKLEDHDELTEVTHDDDTFVKLVTAVEKARTNDMGSPAYANRTWERLADDFATRLGGGPALASGLYKLHNSSSFVFKDSAFYSYPVHAMMQLAGFHLVQIGAIVAPFIAIAVTAVLYISNDPHYQIYDRPKERFQSIRNTMVEELKIPGLTGDLRKLIVADIEWVDSVLADVNDKYNAFELVHLYVTPSGRKDRKAIQYQQDLERMISNDLFVSAAKLKR